MLIDRMNEKMPTTIAGWTIDINRSNENGGRTNEGKPDGTSPTTGKERS